MKKLLLPIVVSIFLLSCSTGETKYHYDKMDNDSPLHFYSGNKENDLIYYKGTPFNGFLHDTYKNGNIKLEGNITNGMRVGMWKGYFENGKINSVRKYKNGEEVYSERTIYNENGDTIHKRETLKSRKLPPWDEENIERP